MAELQASLAGVRALSHSPGIQSFESIHGLSGQMVLKRPFLSDTGEDSIHLFRSRGDRALSLSLRRQSFKSFS